MNKTVLYVPKNLNLKATIEKYPPGFDNFKVEKLILIVHLINALPAKNRKLANKAKKNKGFVSLSSKMLREQGIHNYNEYIQYLRDRSIIERDKYFIRDKKTYGYRICKKYRKPVRRVIVKTIKRKGAKQYLALHNTKKKNKFLKWFYTGQLTIDFEGAVKYLENKYLSSDKTNKEDKINKFNYSIITCSGIHHQDFYHTVDTTSQRVHTNLTNLPRDLKQFITYAGSMLVSVDVKNAQPFFSTAILKQEFYSKDKEFSLGRIIKTNTNNKAKTSEATKQRMKRQANKLFPTITLLNSLKQTETQNIKEYIGLVTSGELYERYMLKYKKLWGKDIPRNIAKKKFIKQLYSRPKHYKNERQTFKLMFPAVHKVFSTLSGEYHNALAILLQRIESFLMIEKVCKRISKERPDLPIFTIHDNIVTTEGNEYYVEQVIKDVLKEYTGYEPQVGIEPWE